MFLLVFGDRLLTRNEELHVSREVKKAGVQSHASLENTET